MTSILHASAPCRMALMIALFLLVCVAAHCTATLCHLKQWKGAGFSGLGTALSFLIMVLIAAGLGDGLPGNVRCFFLQPPAERVVLGPIVWTMIAVFTMLTVMSVWGVQLYRAKGNRLSRASVKECLDTLPTGLCFFAENGMLRLCNRTMYALMYDLLGRDLQSISELKGALDALPQDTTVLAGKISHSFILPDGKVWHFTKGLVRDKDGNPYTQFAAYDLTELYRLTAQQIERSKALQKMLDRLKRIAENVAEITREQEILTAKMRVHNKMGSCLLSARQYSSQGFRPEAKRQMLAVWKETLNALQDEIGHDDEVDACRQLIAVAGSLGVSIHISGAMPEDKAAAYLLVVAMRECLTNMLRHAGGHEMYVDLTATNGATIAAITNDGRRPRGEIIEGGGLTSLRKKIEDAGGDMTVLSLPRFALRLSLPHAADKLEVE